MTLHTQHRRISSRTKRRYKAIRDFLKKAIGNPVRNDININSSIAVNVTDMKHKIVGLERQLNQVAQQCQECLSSKRGTEASEQPLETETEIFSYVTNASTRRNKDIKTKFVYKNRNTSGVGDDNECETLEQYNKSPVVNNNNTHSKISNKKGKNIHSHDNDWNIKKKYDNNSMLFSTSSCHSLITSTIIEQDVKQSDFKDVRKHAKHRKHETSAMAKNIKDTGLYEYIGKHEIRFRPSYSNSGKRIKKSNYQSGVDEDFITNIINKQYKSVKYVGRLDSDISKFSAPVCRDQEFIFKDVIQEGTDLCSCCYNMKQYDKHDRNMICDMRSICDTCLYSSKRHLKTKGNRKHHQIDVYDSTLYDLVPVKEKSSPKSRKKFAEESLRPYEVYSYKEVPPSPRTQRPRLNLRAQYYTGLDDCNMRQVKQRYWKSLNDTKPQCRSEETLVSELYIDAPEHESYRKRSTNFNACRSPALLQKNVETQQDMSIEGYSTYQEPANFNIGDTRNANLNVIREADLDKTDQTLSEIKEILQNFLREIKKENTASCEWSKSETIDSRKKSEDVQKTKDKNCTGMSHGSSNNYNVDQSYVPSPYVPNFQSPYYYPILPMYQNQLQNGCILPSTTFTCPACTSNHHDVPHSSHCTKYKSSDTEKTSKGVPIISAIETEVMIKEIYKAVAQNPESVIKNNQNESSKIGTQKIPSFISTDNHTKSTSIEESVKVIKHDVKVGTPRLKLYSKSCEAICSRTSSVVEEEKSEITKAAYSDTILERASIEATDSTISSDESTYDATTDDKPRESKFSKVLKSFGFFKKKNREDVIEELSESEISTKIRHKAPPFRQNITNYMVHGQECYNRPLIPPYPHCHHNLHHMPHEVSRPEFNPRICDCNSPGPNDKFNSYKMHDSENHHAMPCTRSTRTASPYPTSYESQFSHVDHQVPLCLKEVEVKSIATQSEKKKSLFQKWTKSAQRDTTIVSDELKNSSTQTTQQKKFDWKTLQPKNIQRNLDTAKFTFNTRNELDNGDLNLRKAMLKKLFNKRNPFSPRNLIMKTLLGKDKSSFGDPPKVYRPRMFI